MKKYSIFFAALVCLMVLTVSAFAYDGVAVTEYLPAEVQGFIQKNFPGQSVSYVKTDREFIKTQYEVCLDNGVEIKIDKHGKWDKVNCAFTAVPEGIAPAPIANYVKTHFADAEIVKIDKQHYGYAVELSNYIDIKFDFDGNLKRVAD